MTFVPRSFGFSTIGGKRLILLNFPLKENVLLICNIEAYKNLIFSKVEKALYCLCDIMSCFNLWYDNTFIFHLCEGHYAPVDFISPLDFSPQFSTRTVSSCSSELEFVGEYCLYNSIADYYYNQTIVDIRRNQLYVPQSEQWVEVWRGRGSSWVDYSPSRSVPVRSFISHCFLSVVNIFIAFGPFSHEMAPFAVTSLIAVTAVI